MEFSKKDKRRIERILQIIKKKPQITNNQLSDYLDYNLRLVKDLLKRMENNKIISIKSKYKRTKDNKEIRQYRIMKELSNPVGSLLDTKKDLQKQENNDIPVGSLLDTKVSQLSSKEEERSLINKDEEIIFSNQGEIKQEVKFPNSIRNKAIELNPNLLIDREGNETCVIFGKGFNKYSEALYEL